MRATRAIAATVESVNGVLKNRDIPDLLLFVVDTGHASIAVHAIERGDTRAFTRRETRTYRETLRRRNKKN